MFPGLEFFAIISSREAMLARFGFSLMLQKSGFRNGSIGS
jgi:hypothetical protein